MSRTCKAKRPIRSSVSNVEESGSRWREEDGSSDERGPSEDKTRCFIDLLGPETAKEQEEDQEIPVVRESIVEDNIEDENGEIVSMIYFYTLLN